MVTKLRKKFIRSSPSSRRTAKAALTNRLFFTLTGRRRIRNIPVTQALFYY